ncbi:MAG TPA: glycosyltransferase family 2 protein [Solirubrobacteraceae bacterium]|nr:glycosyltransferase family 2 protein [Solirubrobacteraceae bacterium]
MDDRPAHRGPHDAGPRLTALLEEVYDVERTMAQLRAQVETSEPAPAPQARNGRRNGHGIGNGASPPSTGNGRRNGHLTPPVARSAESDWPIAAVEAPGNDAPPATKTSWAGLLGAAIVGLAGLVYLLAGPAHVATSTAQARLTVFDVAAAALVCFDAYLFVLACMGREPSKRMSVPPRGKPFFVLAIPARQGAEAVANSVRHLLELQYEGFVVVVVDCGDGSVANAALEAGQGNRRVMAERLPGGSRADALNLAYAIACGLVDRQDPRLRGVSAAGTLLGLLKPGAWLEPEALSTVARQFDRQHCAAVQVHVRILGARHSTAAAIEDFETAAFHVIAQTARNRASTAQLTETGSFFRLGALRKVSAQPWVGSLDDELDIALRMIEMGHRIRSSRDTCAYSPGAGSLRALARSRRRRARARRQAWPHTARLWETRRISVASRAATTLDLVGASPLLAPAATLASVLAVGLAVLPTTQSWIAALVPGVGTRAVVLVLFALPLVAMSVAYLGTAGTRRRRAREAPEVAGISGSALPGVAVASLLAGLLRLLPGPSKAPAARVETSRTTFQPMTGPAAHAVPVSAPQPARPVRPARVTPRPVRQPAEPVSHSFNPPAPTSNGTYDVLNARDAETIQQWVRQG